MGAWLLPFSRSDQSHSFVIFLVQTYLFLGNSAKAKLYNFSIDLEWEKKKRLASFHNQYRCMLVGTSASLIKRMMHGGRQAMH
jgi:hypothetical protein